MGYEQSKSKIIYLLKLLYRRADDERGVTMSEILSDLQSNGVSAERKSIYRDIMLLRECGIEIEKNNRRPVEYCLMNRTFDIAELRLLADAVQSASFISKPMTEKLLRKIQTLTSTRRALIIKGQTHYFGRVKTENEHVRYATATIQEAIHRGCRIRFKYMDYDVRKGINPRRGGSQYEVSPYALVWNENNYYLVGDYERRGGIRFFRVDRAKAVEMTEIESAALPPCFNLGDFIKTKFGMFVGEQITLDLRFQNKLITPVIDRFGTKTPILCDGDDHFIAHVDASVSPVFFSWIFQFGDGAQILKPERIARDYIRYLKATLEAMECTED